MKRILIADDHPLVRLGLKVAVQKYFPECKVDESMDSESTLALLKSAHFDLVMLDLVMPDSDPSDLLHWIRNFSPQTRVLVVSMNNEDIFGRWSMRMGAHGYIEKDASAEELVKAVNTVLSGKKYMSEELAESIINATLDGASGNPFDDLSTREFQIAMYIVQDYSLSEISAQLQLQYSSVSSVQRRIFEKLKIKDRKTLIQLAQIYRFS